MKDKSKKSTYSTTFGVAPYTYNALGSVSEINLNGESKIVNTYDDLQRISSSSYMLGTSELKKLEYKLDKR